MNHQPKYSSRNPPPSNRQLFTLLGIIVAIIIIGFWLINLLLDVLIGAIPPEVEKRLGSAIVPHFEEQSEASPVQATLNQLLDRLEQPLKSERNYRVLYISKSTVNALAIPGDVIVIYRGLLEQIKSENELMMILGHEIGHFVHRDHLKSLGRVLLMNAVLSSIIGDWAGSITVAVQTVSNAQYSQSQENQADEFGLTLLNNTYGHVAGATDFFARLSKGRNEGWRFLASHPSSRQRVGKLEKLIIEHGYQKGNYSALPTVLQ